MSSLISSLSLSHLTATPSTSPRSPPPTHLSSRPHSSLPSLLSLLPALLCLLLFPISISSTFFSPLCSTIATQPCDTPSNASWSPRSQEFTFYWAGAVWIAGGIQTTVTNNVPMGLELNDVWGSYDLGRTWQMTAAPLPTAGCSSSTAHAVHYSGGIWITCDSYIDTNHRTFYSNSPTLAYWNEVNVGGDDGLGQRIGYSVDWMAVPYDGIGTLVLLAGNTGNDNNDVWTLSTTGNFRTGDSSYLTYRWNRFQDQVYSGPYLSPWVVRTKHMTTTDAEHLVLILLGGNYEPPTSTMGEDPTMNDVWQMSWVDGFTNPLWYLLTANAPWPARKLGVVWRVHDWYFLYGGTEADGDFINGNPISSLDDVWRSSDYCSTWAKAADEGTGIPRHGNDPLVVGRRFFVVGGSNGVDSIAAFTPPSSYFNDVWVGYW